MRLERFSTPSWQPAKNQDCSFSLALLHQFRGQAVLLGVGVGVEGGSAEVSTSGSTSTLFPISLSLSLLWLCATNGACLGQQTLPPSKAMPLVLTLGTAPAPLQKVPAAFTSLHPVLLHSAIHSWCLLVFGSWASAADSLSIKSTEGTDLSCAGTDRPVGLCWNKHGLGAGWSILGEHPCSHPYPGVGANGLLGSPSAA